MTVQIWKIWNPGQPDKPRMRVDRQKITESKEKKYKDTKKVSKRQRSTSRES